MNAWWANLEPVHQGFYMAAGVFSLILLWQLVSAILGLDADADMDVPDDVDFDVDAGLDDIEADGDVDAAISSFHLLSFRSVIAFFTLFTWGTSLYLTEGWFLAKAMTFGILWGLLGMFVVAWLLYGLKKMSESGNMKLNSCIGQKGTVYINIPENGQGEVKVLVSDVSTHVKARGAGGKAIEANTPVKVIKRVAQDIFEVEEVKAE